MQFLINEGANVNHETRTGDTPLLRACAAGAFPVVELLLKNGAEASHRNAGGVTPLVRAIGYGATDIVALLLQRGAGPTQRTRRGGRSRVGGKGIAAFHGRPSPVTPLLLAAQRGFRTIAELLLSFPSARRVRERVWRLRAHYFTPWPYPPPFTSPRRRVART